MMVAIPKGRKHSPITLRRAAALAELFSLGIWAAKASELLDIDPVRVSQISSAFGLVAPRKKQRTALQEQVSRLYAAGLSVRQVAERLGRSERCIRVIACRLRLRNSYKRDPGFKKRGWEIPRDRRDEYLELRRMGCTFEECRLHFGIPTNDLAAQCVEV